MNKEVERVAKNIAARRAATAAGKSWNELPLQERRERIVASIAQVTDDDRERAIRSVARKAAKEAGFDWAKATREQRHSFIRQAKAKTT